MAKLYLIGIASHYEYKKEYCKAAVSTGAKEVFIEEMNNDWHDSLQKKMYKELIENNLKLIPIAPKEKIKLDTDGLSFVELYYALNIKKNLENKDYCFTIGSAHLCPKEKDESPLEFALKAIGCDIEVLCNNFLKDYPLGYEKIINQRKKIISHLIQGMHL
ncbi:MAG: hypothetical protein WC376_05105 [Candidatus Nanoarchaeia archaeon]|jgi:hypothetical protein